MDDWLIAQQQRNWWYEVHLLENEKPRKINFMMLASITPHPNPLFVRGYGYASGFSVAAQRPFRSPEGGSEPHVKLGAQSHLF